VSINQQLSSLEELTHGACVGSFSAVIDPPSANKPLVAEAEPLLVNRDEAARLLCVSTPALDRLWASGHIVARRHPAAATTIGLCAERVLHEPASPKARGVCLRLA
jgi:hypothetical protein